MVKLVVPLGLTVGEAAAQLTGGGTKVSASQIRKLEREGLLPPPSRTAGNYRIFTEEDLERVRMVSGLRALGQSLPTIKETLQLLQSQKPPGERNEDVQRHLEQLEATLDTQMHRLRELKSSLKKYRR